MDSKWRALWRILLSLHAAAAIAWWWLMPQGFSPIHTRFWSNLALPATVVALTLIGLDAAIRDQPRRLLPVLLALATAWLGAGVTTWAIFPESGAPVGQTAIAMGLCLFAAVWRSCRKLVIPKFPSASAAGCALVVGVLVPLSQQAPLPDTRPMDAGTDSLDRITARGPDRPSRFAAPEGVTWFPGDGSLTFRARTLRLDVDPFLAFEDHSPDRCWTILAPASSRQMAGRRLLGIFNDEPDQFSAAYQDRYRSVLHVEAAREDGVLGITAMTHLPEAVFSHLNSFCEMRVHGHRRLAVTFSPCPDARIDVLPCDYPTGRPARFAYLGRDGLFRVVEATDAEKGPFRVLAEGPFDWAMPLRLTIHDEAAPILRCELLDWATQASFAPSPTAGWGVPVNGIEFRLLGDDPRSPAAIWFTLAATSIGRGWDSVGHSPGTYHNRLRIKRIGSKRDP